MLKQVLKEIEKAKGAISLSALSKKLHVAPGALDGMIDYWVRKGKILIDGAEIKPSVACGGCGPTCPGPNECPMTLKLPRTLIINFDDLE